MEEYSVIGKPIPRVDGLEKASGDGKYAADFSFPGMLWCKILRSPYAHAKILNIDTSRAESHFGVRAVCTGKDFNGYTWGFMPQTRDEPPLAVGKVRYQGEAVAAVCAVDEETAEEAAELIRVDYEELPGVFDPEEAMKPGAPAVHDYVENNQSWEFHMDFGDVEKGFAESDIVREDRFATGKVLTGFLEPPAAIALYDSNGITMWAAKQSPYFVYRHMAACFNLPLNKIRIIQPFIGAGFGGTKNDSVAGDFCSVLFSKWTGRHVKFVYSLQEVFATCRRRHNMRVFSKMGMKKDGTLMALQQKVVAEGGAYTAIGPLTMYLTGAMTTLPYKLPNFKHDAYRIFTNHPVSAAMRGHGVTHTRFAAEIQMDMLAEELGIDPMDIRLKNAIEAPYETVNHVTVKSCGMKEGLEILKNTELWKRRGKGAAAGRGVGLAAASYLGGARQLGHQSCAAIVRLCEDGTVNYLTGATDCGQGSDTVLVQIVAEELGIRVEDVTIRRVDTAITPCDAGSYGSRVTVLAGAAAQKAAQDVKRQLAEIAAGSWKVKPDEIVFRDGMAFVENRPNMSMSFEKLAKIACYSGSGAVILGRGYSQYGIENYDWDKGTGNPGTSYSFTSQLAEVEVDLETGVPRCESTILTHDCGRPLNPLNVQAQNQGGTIQALGQTLYEGFVTDQGTTRNANLTDYKMPLATDVPSIELIDIIAEDPDGPYGAKEASEGCIVSTPPAVVSALKDATGIWFKTLPVTPEKIYWALQEKKKANKAE